jgi:hypothetical protein
MFTGVAFTTAQSFTLWCWHIVYTVCVCVMCELNMSYPSKYIVHTQIRLPGRPHKYTEMTAVPKGTVSNSTAVK